MSRRTGLPIARQRQPGRIFFRRTSSTTAEGELLAYLQGKTKRPFALEHGPLLRVHLLKRSTGNDRLMVIHHIAFDIGSVLPLLRELTHAYDAVSRGERAAFEVMPASYTDFVAWERQMMLGPEGAEHLAYWRQHLAGAPAVLALPTDRPRNLAPSFIGRTLSRRISGGLEGGHRVFCARPAGDTRDAVPGALPAVAQPLLRRRGYRHRDVDGEQASA